MSETRRGRAGTALDGYAVRRIDYRTAMAVVVDRHYLHRKAPCSHAFGLFDVDDCLRGVIVYGTPSSAPLRRGIAGDEHRNDVIELTRLWIDDAVPRNGESFLIGCTLHWIDKDIVVSFAEIEQGHIGVVYQATNWFYTGLSAKRTNWTIEGVDKHCQTIADKWTAAEIRAAYGDAFSLQPRPRKHRYVYLRGTKRRRAELLAALRYPILPYPRVEVIV